MAGHDTTIIETTMFMGREQRVLVAHAGFPEQRSRVMVYATGMGREEFSAILAGIALAPQP